MNGTITEIERFALNDGPGIRTTVFLKGCNMNCPWCHNPETIHPTCDLHYYATKCIGCFKCVAACPSKAHKRIAGEHRFYPNLCIKCGKCASVCYAEAMTMSGRAITKAEAMREILPDKPYYLNSGGGVTLSGGEVLCQQDFAQNLMDECHRNNIPVAIESNLHQPWAQIEHFICDLDLIMCDLKLDDTEAHKKWTGVHNDLIKDNILHIGQGETPYIVRTPLIPGVSDTDENIAAIADFVAKTNTNGKLMYYELLNFNPLGDSKYISLQKTNLFQDSKPLPATRIKELQAIAQKSGIPVRAEL